MSTNQKNQLGKSEIRLAELVAALSLATDLGMGQPLEYTLSVCVLSVRLGEALGLDEDKTINRENSLCWLTPDQVHL